jgi:hypothetical protein
MQLTHPAETLTVDFYPEAFIADEGVNRYIKCVSFSTGQKSYSIVSKTTFKHEVANRLACGYKVTDFHTEKFDNYATYNPMAGACRRDC